MFAWREASWYGSEVEERIDERQKLTEMIISPLQAMDYLAAPEPVRLLKTEWTGFESPCCATWLSCCISRFKRAGMRPIGHGGQRRVPGVEAGYPSYEGLRSWDEIQTDRSRD